MHSPVVLAADIDQDIVPVGDSPFEDIAEHLEVFEALAVVYTQAVVGNCSYVEAQGHLERLALAVEHQIVGAAASKVTVYCQSFGNGLTFDKFLTGSRA